MTPDFDYAEALSVFLDESGHTERVWEETRCVDTETEYRKRHPETPPEMRRATILALAYLEQQCPAHLREKAWPPNH